MYPYVSIGAYMCIYCIYISYIYIHIGQPIWVIWVSLKIGCMHTAKLHLNMITKHQIWGTVCQTKTICWSKREKHASNCKHTAQRCEDVQDYMAGYDSSTSTYYIQISPCVDELSRDITKEFPLVSSPKKKEDPFNFQPELVGLFHPIPTSFFVWIPSFTIPMRKKTHHRNQGTKWVWVKKSWQKKRKCLKLYGSMNFPKLSPQVLKKTSAPVALSLDFPLSLHLVSPVFPGQTSWPLVDV